MPIFTAPLPLSLYIHLPWCVRKCPYCDFNSHEMKGSLPEELYVAALIEELESHLEILNNRPLTSVFFGGGTPSLFSANAIAKILEGVNQHLPLDINTEITLEANPGAVDQVRFSEFRQAGVNRLSLGLQSLQNDKLKTLGRIHDRDEAMRAIIIAKEAGFINFNLDLMFGLPNQSVDDALQDLQAALSFGPLHLSWYQLTIEPNTLFYKQTPVLPADDRIWEMQLAGQSLLKTHGFQQYEVSAYSLPNRECIHNRNYWEFGDYLGIGAGAHSKITEIEKGSVIRFSQVKQPRDYLDRHKREGRPRQAISETDLMFEFMLNVLRLTQGVPTGLFTQRTGLPLSQAVPFIAIAKQRGLMQEESSRLWATSLGMKFLNDLVSIFLP